MSSYSHESINSERSLNFYVSRGRTSWFSERRVRWDRYICDVCRRVYAREKIDVDTGEVLYREGSKQCDSRLKRCRNGNLG
jgi:hypothetical protein